MNEKMKNENLHCSKMRSLDHLYHSLSKNIIKWSKREISNSFNKIQIIYLYSSLHPFIDIVQLKSYKIIWENRINLRSKIKVYSLEAYQSLQCKQQLSHCHLAYKYIQISQLSKRKDIKNRFSDKPFPLVSLAFTSIPPPSELKYVSPTSSKHNQIINLEKIEDYGKSDKIWN